MNKKELLEVRKLFAKKSCRVETVAGVYMGIDQNVIASFSNHLATLDEDTSDLYLSLSRKGISGTLQKNQFCVDFPNAEEQADGKQNLLMKIRQSKCTNTALLETYCQQEDLLLDTNYLILFSYGIYDVPAKTKDGKSTGTSSVVYEFLHIDFCPVNEAKPTISFNAKSGKFEKTPAAMTVLPPVCGLLFPAFDDREPNVHSALYYTKSAVDRKEEMAQALTGIDALPLDAAGQKAAFANTVEDALGRDCNFASARDAAIAISNLAGSDDNGSVKAGAYEITHILEDTDSGKKNADNIKKAVDANFGDGATVDAESISSGKSIKIESPRVKISVDRDAAELMQTSVVNGRECILIPIEDGIRVEGIRVLPSKQN